ncbi:MAG: cation-translocating P-type ATPase, partial [Candidatus Firestonebacteria bacterium]|nr:cation-translocating P-type ATPase [Candidatus Firestonebacteria bacterium]
TSLAYGRGHAVITGTGMHTELGKIAKDVAAVQTGKTPLEKRTAEIGKWLSLTAAGICVLVTGVSLLREYLHQPLELDFALKMLMFGVALAVAAVPEALAGIVTGALAIGMHQMAKRHALVRKMSAVETLGCTTVICSDKTGTLTKGEMTVRKIVLLSGTLDVAGSGYDTAGGFSGPIQMPEAALAQLLKAGSLCNDSELYAEAGKTKVKGDPTEGALLVAAAKKGLNPLELKLQNPRIQEFPFSSERKRMTTVHRMNDGKVFAFVKGAPETILPRCSAYGDSGTVQVLSGEDRNALAQANDDLAQAAYRVLALACKEIRAEDADQEETVESNLVFLGLVGMMDPPRPEAVEAARICRQVRIKPVMITGDHLLTAVAVAREIGFYQQGDTVLTGAALEKLTDLEFEAIVDRVTVYARVAPRDKLRIVTAWKKRGDVVAMTGDGVNDAPALKAADIGIAMGITGTEVSKEAADMILNDDNFATIVTAIELGRWVYDNIKKYLTYLLRCNLVEVAVIGGAALIFGPEFLPLLPASILYINLGTDGLPALALGVAPADPDLMRRPPRDPRESIFSQDVMLFMLASLMIEIPFFYYIFTSNLENLTHARTQMFFLFLGVELIVALNFRSMKFSVFTARPHLWLVLAVVWEFLLAALLVQLPAVRRAFGITLPSWNDLLILVSFSLLIFASLEGIKAFLRHRERKQEGCRPAT